MLEFIFRKKVNKTGENNPWLREIEQVYEQITTELRQKLDEIPPQIAINNKEHLADIKELEMKLSGLGGYACKAPQFFSWGKMREIKLLLRDAAKYLNKTGTDFNCLVAGRDRYGELKHEVRIGTQSYWANRRLEGLISLKT